MLLQVTSAVAPMDVPQQVAVADFASIYATWFRVVYRWVGALGGPRSDLEDVVQEVFLIVQRKLVDFDGENLAGWPATTTWR